MHLAFIFLVLIGAIWSPLSHHHGFVFANEGKPDGGFTTCPREIFGQCRHKLGSSIEKTKIIVSENTQEVLSKLHNLEEHVKDVIDVAVGKVCDPEVKLSDKLSEKVKIAGEKTTEVAGNVKNTLGEVLGLFTLKESTKGTLKDSVVKMEQWDVIDSPKRIGEDIEANASRKVEETVEDAKEMVKIVKETSWNDLLTRSTRKVTVLIDKIQSVISLCHLFGFSIAYGMGVWVTFFSSYVLRKCLPKGQHQMIVNKLYMVYFRAMTHCMGAALIGFLVSRGRRVFFLWNKMEIFQGFNLLSALIMNLINMVFLEPRASKLDLERKKMKENNGAKSVLVEGLKKVNTYSSTLNMSTMVVLTWHLAYVGQLLQVARHPDLWQ